ncbi:Histidine kinase, double cache and PAS domains-containing [Desulfonema limicola]|uniref:Histidine kinase, double cache and PAS domains-containing n=2 Tax=Desulfonema limicola TaxID=45656 RepID=A0A975B780_9BACT|nr:Histidine kinase, double cache and PAS domains-containing [Desulfonema limicola]
MKLRLIILGLSMLALISASAGGYLYYSSVKKTVIKDAEKQAYTRTEMIKKHISALFSEYKKPIKILAGIQEIPGALLEPTPGNLEKASLIADHFNTSLDADVCYITDKNGNTIISSNRNDPDSFLGENFRFRPYFQNAIQGIPDTYLAIGKTSGKRGIYYSHPVHAKHMKEPLGAAVIKASVQDIEDNLILEPGEIILLTSPQDIIFVSTRKEWLYGLLWKESENKISEIAQTRQFGTGPWHWTGLKKNSSRYAADKQKNKYLIHISEMDDYRGWHIVHLQDPGIIAKRLSDPFIRITGTIIIVLGFLFVFLVLLLYMNAGKEIARREKAEDALRLAKEELGLYTKDLERQVAERTREITGILKYTPDVIYIKDVNERYLLVNSRYEELFGVKNEEIRGKTAREFMAEDIAKEFQISDHKVLMEKRSCQVEHNVSQDGEVYTYLSVKFPIYDEEGNISGVGGISTDITVFKKNQEQLRRLSGSVITGQEKERTAIARELHDELGQLLTALRMDAVWILNRIKDKDKKACEHASAMRDLIDKTIDDVRSIAIRLRPGVLDDLGLTDALEWLTADFERRTGITCIFEHSIIPVISNTIATVAYRIAQESLTNIARHANATHVDVSLHEQNRILRLTISDDGQGFDILSAKESLGLAGMRERAGIVGGILDIESLPREGTRISFELKIDAQGDL